METFFADLVKQVKTIAPHVDDSEIIGAITPAIHRNVFMSIFSVTIPFGTSPEQIEDIKQKAFKSVGANIVSTFFDVLSKKQDLMLTKHIEYRVWVVKP